MTSKLETVENYEAARRLRLLVQTAANKKNLKLSDLEELAYSAFNVGLNITETPQAFNIEDLKEKKTIKSLKKLAELENTYHEQPRNIIVRVLRNADWNHRKMKLLYVDKKGEWSVREIAHPDWSHPNYFRAISADGVKNFSFSGVRKITVSSK